MHLFAWLSWLFTSLTCWYGACCFVGFVVLLWSELCLTVNVGFVAVGVMNCWCLGAILVSLA